MFVLGFVGFFMSLFFLIKSLYMEKDNFILHAELFFIALFSYILSWSVELSLLPLLSTDVNTYFGFTVLFKFQSIFLSVLFFALIIALVLFFKQIANRR